MGYAFISYSHKDSAFVSTLFSRLKREGLPCQYDRSIVQPGDIWDDKIHDALKHAERLIVVMSPELNGVD